MRHIKYIYNCFGYYHSIRCQLGSLQMLVCWVPGAAHAFDYRAVHASVCNIVFSDVVMAAVESYVLRISPNAFQYYQAVCVFCCV